MRKIPRPRRTTITAKRLKNKRFRKTEEAILNTYLQGDIFISVDQMAKQIGVARSTVYNHHGSVRAIIPNYQKYILASYSRMINKILKNKQAPIKKILLSTLVFILSNKRIFLIFTKVNDLEVYSIMLNRIKKKIISSEHFPSNHSDRIFRIYKAEIIAILKEWGEKDYSEKHLDKVLSDILYLTKTARERLKGI